MARDLTVKMVAAGTGYFGEACARSGLAGFAHVSGSGRVGSRYRWVGPFGGYGGGGVREGWGEFGFGNGWIGGYGQVRI